MARTDEISSIRDYFVVAARAALAASVPRTATRTERVSPLVSFDDVESNDTGEDFSPYGGGF